MAEKRKPTFIFQALKVIYAPHKVFKEIVEKPGYLGPIFIMILFTVAYALSGYTFLSRTYNEQVFPSMSNGDVWTESSTMWVSNGVLNESTDCISGGSYGNRSIESVVVNDNQVWMQLSNIGPVNCAGLEGYKNLTFRLKPIYPNTTELVRASIYLFSNETSYYCYNLTRQPALLGNNIWNNRTISVGDNTDWTNNGTNSDWSNINSIRLELAWSKNENITFRLDGLFFRGVFNASTDNITTYLLSFAITAMMQFVIRWIAITGLLFILLRALRTKTVWRLLLISIGFALITMLIQTVVVTIAFATLPKIYYSFDLTGGTQGEAQIAQNVLSENTWLVSQFITYVQIAVIIWTVALCAMATKSLTELSWPKIITIVTIAYFISMLAEAFLLRA